MVQSAHAADQPQQIRKRFTLVAVIAALRDVTPIAAAALSGDTFAHNSR